MATHRTFTLDVPADPATAGTAHPIGNYSYKSLTLTTSGGSYLVQVSNDEVSWEDIGSAVTGNAFLSTEDLSNPLPRSVRFIRIFTTTASDLVATFHGQDFVS